MHVRPASAARAVTAALVAVPLLLGGLPGAFLDRAAPAGAVTATSAPARATTTTARTGTGAGRTTTTFEPVEGIPQGAGRQAPVNADGGLPSSGTTLPAGPVRVRLTAVAVANQPVGVAARRGDASLYVIEKAGRIRAVRGGRLEAAPVLDLTGRVASTNENGLLGLAFPAGPDAERHPVLYAAYNASDRALTVSEFPFDGTRADPTRERVLLSLPKTTDEHNAGTLVATSDGLLWVAIGDGGPAGDPKNNAQRLDRLLRQGPAHRPTRPTDELPYGIPPDNPYARRASGLGGSTPASARREIWAYGLRKPVAADGRRADRRRVDPRRRRDLVRGDQPCARVARRRQPRVAAARRADPVQGRQAPWRDRSRARVPAQGRPVRGRRRWRVRGRAMPALQGAYVFGDVCTGRIDALVPDGNRWRAVSLGARLGYLTGFGTGPDGELYATSLEGGVVALGPAGTAPAARAR